MSDGSSSKIIGLDGLIKQSGEGSGGGQKASVSGSPMPSRPSYKSGGKSGGVSPGRKGGMRAQGKKRARPAPPRRRP